MIIGVGMDLVEIGRIRRSMKKERFLRDYYGLQEQALFAARNQSAETVAANFAAKEAFAKSLGYGVRGFLLREVQTLRDDRGAPYLLLSGRAKQKAAEAGIKRFHVSITHSKEFAAATVIAEQ